jgi:endoglycosylceramidase
VIWTAPGRPAAARAAAGSGRERLLGAADDRDAADGSPAHRTRIDVSATGHDADELSPVAGTDGRFFVDDHGRRIVLHGVNVVYKTPPYHPRPADSVAERFDASDVARIADWGFDLVRLGVLWAGVEPEPVDLDGGSAPPGGFDESYLGALSELVATFADHGVYVLLDMHQDLYGPRFGGDGAPSWAARSGGWPLSPDWVDGWEADYLQPAVATAFDHLWRDEDLQAHLAAAWRRVAAALGDHRNVVGYDLFNEPVPGYRTAAGFEREHLSRFYDRAVAAIRTVDGTTPVWVEPWPAFSFGATSGLRPVADDGPVAVSFHNYVALVVRDAVRARFGDVQHWLWTRVLDNADALAARQGGVPVMTEFGARDDPDEVGALVELADEWLTGWAYWEYKGEAGWNPEKQRTDDQSLVKRDGSTSPNLEVLVRPYPKATAGEPLAYRFHRERRRFTFRYAPDDSATAETVVFVPERHYPDGAAVTVIGAVPVHRGGQHLRLQHRDDTEGPVTVRIEPA